MHAYLNKEMDLVISRGGDLMSSTLKHTCFNIFFCYKLETKK